MSDEEMVERFEAGTLPKGSFHHKDHVKVAWLLLHRYPVLEALQRFSDGLQRIARAFGKEGLYHETITWAYLFLINERMVRGEERDWEDFARNNPDLLNWQQSVLKTYYREQTLMSETARSIFVFPDRVAG